MYVYTTFGRVSPHTRRMPVGRTQAGNAIATQTQLVMHWIVMHALANDSPGWPGDVSVTDLPCVHAIYMEDRRRQTIDSCKKLMVSVCETTPFPFCPLQHRASLDARTPRIRHTFFQDGRRSVHSGFSPRAPRQQLILARLLPYIDVRYSVRRLGMFGRFSSMFAGGVREQRLGFFFCIGSIGACAENRIVSP